MEKNLDHYDYIMLQVAWETNRKSATLGQKEMAFVQSMLNKYQLRVITEKGYRNKDQKSRVTQIVNRDNDLKKYFAANPAKNMDQIRAGATQLLNNDMRTLTGLGQDKVPAKGASIATSVHGTPIAVGAAFSMFGANQQQEQLVRRRVQNVARESYTHHPDGSLREQTARQELLGDASERLNQELSAQEFQRRMQQSITLGLENIQRNVTEGIALQLEAMQVEFKNTQTQMDGQASVEVLQDSAQIRKDVEKLVQMSQGGQSWDQIPLKDLPKWFKNKLVSGLKRSAISLVMLPITIPASIVSAVVITPFKLVKRDIGSIIELIQRIWGWIMVAFLVAGVWVVMTHPEYEEQRQEFWAHYATVVEYIDSKFVEAVSEPTRQTIQWLSKAIPGQKFFKLVVETMWMTVQNLGSSLVSFAYTLFTTVVSTMKDAIAAAVSGAVQNMSTGVTEGVAKLFTWNWN